MYVCTYVCLVGPEVKDFSSLFHQIWEKAMNRLVRLEV
jgi:hypothetical protein